MKNHRYQQLWLEWLRPVVLVAAVMLPFRSVIADWNEVPTGSMKPTIVEGDRIFVDKLAYALRLPFTTIRLATWAEPQRGDIVVFFAPDSGTRLVKRVVGLPGDRLELRAGVLSVNGQALAYSAAAPADVAALPAAERRQHVFASEQLDHARHPVMLWRGPAPARSFAPLEVPPDHYFMMGDNRDNSRDSRYFGFVPRASIVGRATRVIASLDPDNHRLPRPDRFLRPLP